MNLLVIMSDEHRWDALGCLQPRVKTPHLDRLAARGAHFTNAYTSSPMCVPARAALACGDYVHRLGNWDSATPYNGNPTSWMHALRTAGYDVQAFGKLHFRANEDDNGFSAENLPMHVFQGIGWPVGLLRQPPLPDYDGAAELAAQVGRGESTYTRYDRAITQAFTQWLGNAAPRSNWAAFVSLVSPHYPLTCPPEFLDLYPAESMEAPLAYAAAARPQHPEIRNIVSFFNYDQYFDPARMLAARAAYYGLCSFADHCVGRILTALEQRGQLEQTLVLYISDHGEMLGDHGIWTKQVMYQGSAAIPLLLAGPGVAPGQRIESGVSLVDVAATARAVAGLPPRDDLPGLDLRRVAAGEAAARVVFSEYHDGGSTTAAFMLRWQNWKYVHYVGYPPQLFDLAADPQELNDLATAATAKPALQQGEYHLRQICDPDAVNTRCFAAQARRIAELGGEQACRQAYQFNHTPAPG